MARFSAGMKLPRDFVKELIDFHILICHYSSLVSRRTGTALEDKKFNTAVAPRRLVSTVL